MKNACDILFETLKSADSSLGDLRLKNAIYYENENLLEIEAISDVSVLEDSKNFVLNAIKDKLNGVNNVKLNICKSVCDKDLAQKVILKYLKEKCFHVAHVIKDSDVLVFSLSKRIVFEIKLSSDIADYFNRTSELQKMCECLSRSYCHDFEGSIKITERDEEAFSYDIDEVNYSELEDSTLRYVKMQNLLKFCDDTTYDTAIYIEDGKNRLGTNYFCGVVVSKEEKIAKNNKPYHMITLDDKTGKISGRYFTSDKNKLKKLEKVDVGSVIIVRGENELYNEKMSFTIKGYHFCEFPTGYKPKEKPFKKAPERYSVVFPEKIFTLKQDNFLMEAQNIPVEILNGVYSVVDIETTGTDVNSDEITEVAAVKIENGVIVEKFQTLINPKVPIPERIVELTGIDDELVKDSPTLDKIYPDFYKFIENTVFVAHNAEFDFRFLKNKGRELGYLLNNEVLDTLALSRKVLPSLRHHKLNNVCDYYGITFKHHRALSDAMATAEMLLELVKGKKSLKDI